MNSKPTTKKDAYLNGAECRQNNKSIHYNPFRNTGVETSHLYAAWEDGWTDTDNEVK